VSDLPAAGVALSGAESCRFTTVLQAFQARTRDAASEVAFPEWAGLAPVSWAEYGRRVEQSAQALAGLGVRHGDAVALLLSARRDFHWLDLAVAHLGATSVSLYATTPVPMMRYQLADAGARILVTEQAFADPASELAGGLDHVFLVDGAGGGLPGWQSAIDGRDRDLDVARTAEAVEPADVALLIYTSGTTGPPKGVELTHGNLMYLTWAIQQRLRIPAGTVQLSHLPMAHMMAREFDHYLHSLVGFGVVHCPDPRKVAEYLLAVRPSFFTSTPRLWEKLRTAVLACIESEPDPARKSRLQSALKVGIERSRAEQEYYRTGAQADPLLLNAFDEANRSVLPQLRGLVGLDRVQAALIGGAPVPAELTEFYHAIGVPLGEAYGFTEGGAAATANPPDRVRFGTVGPALDGVQLKLASDGEILVKSPGVMKGYRNLPEQTAAAFDDDGWLRSGDVGVLEADGYLRIVDRKKDIIINTAGKTMSPAYIESHLAAASPLIGTAVAIGDRRPYDVALITLDPVAAAAFARQRGIEATTPDALAEVPAIMDEITAAVSRANAQLARVEQIKKFRIIPFSWAPGGDELTATMKLKRAAIADKYAHVIDDLYRS
jgi:long-subunit acyl-CoA synthetase (AMP-forming)